MIAKTMIVTVVIVLALAGTGGISSAESLPISFENGWVGFLCVHAAVPGFPPVDVLVQLNFDKTVRGGIGLGQADDIFNLIAGNLPGLSALIGDIVRTTCSVSPGQVQSAAPGANALQAAEQLAGNYQFRQLGFEQYVILNSYRSLTPPYLEPRETLAIDVLVVVGSKNVAYSGSVTIPPSNPRDGHP